MAPSLAIGHQIGDALAHSGTPWVNLRFESVRTLIDAVVGFDLAMEGARVLSRAQALSLVEAACDRVVDANSYFAALVDRPGLHRALQRSIDDLRLAGVHLQSSRTGFEDERKGRDLATILEAYEEELARGNYVDRPALLLRAIRKLEADGSPWRAATSWLLLEDVELSAEEERFMELASQGRLTRLCSDEQDAARDRPPVELVRAVGEENEIRAALRTLLSGPCPFDAAEVVYSRRDAYLPLAYEICSELSVPATFAEGIAASYTRPGRACVAFLEWSGGGWDANVLQRAARGGALELPQIADTDRRLSPTVFTRLVRDTRIGWGRERYLERIDAWIDERNADRDDDEVRAERRASDIENAVATRTLFEEMLRLSEPFAGGDEVDITLLAAAAAMFVEKLAATRSEIDGMAKSGIRRMLDELADLPPAPAPRLEATTRLADAVRQLHVAASNPRPGHLHFAPLHAGGWSGRPRTFIIGFDDAKFPGAGLQDPILLDSERSALNEVTGTSRLRMLADVPERMTKQFERLLRRLTQPAAHGDASDRVIFVSYPMLDVIGRRARYPSAAVLEAFRSSRDRDKGASYQDAIAAAATAGFVGEPPLTEAEWWISRRGEGPLREDDVYRRYPWLGSGAQAIAARESAELTKWDAFIDAPREEIDPRYRDKVYSASQLQEMARCPIGYFFRRHLRIEPIEQLEHDPDVWLNAMENGSLFHAIAERFMKEVCSSGQRPTQNSRARLLQIADEELQSWRRLVPPPNETAFTRGRDELFETLDVFLHGEIDCGTVVAKYFEAPFGYPADDSSSLAMPDPLELDLGGGRSIRVRGRIDRVDFDEASRTWNVWDYKTGSAWGYGDGVRLARGTKIQHALYARAICAMLERNGEIPAIGQSGYYFPTTRAKRLRRAMGCESGELENALNLLFDVVGRGFFPHPRKDDCAYCEYMHVRGDLAVAEEQMARKYEANADHPAVKAWLALQEVK